MNKNVLITGSSKGIGKSIAKILAKYNHNVYLCARNEDALQKAIAETGAKGYFVIDLTNPNACSDLFENFIKKVGTIDVLVNNAGSYTYAPIEQTKIEDIKEIIKLNIETPYLLTQMATKEMKKQKWGRIINIGSISGVVGEANASLYSMTKSAYIGFTKALALELAQDNITVNTIHPGWVDTDLAQDAIEKSDFSQQEELEMIPQRRFIHPDEIAELVSYLISDSAKGLTGQNINLCAGLSVG